MVESVGNQWAQLIYTNVWFSHFSISVKKYLDFFFLAVLRGRNVEQQETWGERQGFDMERSILRIECYYFVRLCFLVFISLDLINIDINTLITSADFLGLCLELLFQTYFSAVVAQKSHDKSPDVAHKKVKKKKKCYRSISDSFQLRVKHPIVSTWPI